MDEVPAQETILFTNATLWTSTADGNIDRGWLVISGGKITGIGSGAQPATNGKIRIIDCQGKQISPGLIDCHSHTGISRGVNEAGQAVSAEVRIADVTDPDDINWYRELAGGVTTVNSLHGSANPIGGQVQTNKIRWGCIRPDDMHFGGAKPGIKFALGENVKQSHWGDTQVTRYPQTRMGVETTFRDRFTAAEEYLAEWNGSPPGLLSQKPIEGGTAYSFVRLPKAGEAPVIPPRRDLELEALAEILRGERIIHCHSYRQDEILMLCRICDEFGIRLGAWQHGLECYKVADEVKTHAIGASIFSDWWNYKVEVQDAIPQAGPILWEQGVVVSYNSDSDELARRLNVECAKAIKYCDPENPISPEEALKLMTINPARQLMIDKWVGSLEVGKDADLVVWSGSPLSAMTRCEQTWIDGRCSFSLEKDAEARKQIASERRRIIQKILSLSTPEEKKAEEPKKNEGPEGGDPKDEYDRAALRERNLDLLRRGIDPAAATCGDCGMTQVNQK
jgi:N-acetylglucosamine-6-phosphate deacetylase